MHEGLPPTTENKVEKGPEQFPSEEEIVALFEKITEGKEYEVTRKKEDENGVYLFEIKITEPSEDGGTAEYSYGRTGQYPENKSLETAIHVMYFDADGIPEGGHAVAKYSEGSWQDIGPLE